MSNGALWIISVASLIKFRNFSAMSSNLGAFLNFLSFIPCTFVAFSSTFMSGCNSVWYFLPVILLFTISTQPISIILCPWLILFSFFRFNPVVSVSNTTNLSIFFEMSFSDEFYDIQGQFVGDGLNVFFNAEDFRVYLNDFFASGVTTTAEDIGFVHWIFTANDGTVCDSIALGHQPVDDTHCTIFSLFYEVLRFKGGFLVPLKDMLVIDDLEVQGSREHCLNLVNLYSMLEVLFSYRPFTDHVEDFKPWSSYPSGWTSKYSALATSNREYLLAYVSMLDDDDDLSLGDTSSTADESDEDSS